MKDTHKRIETISNIAIIVVAAALLTTLVYRYYTPSPTRPSPPNNPEIASGMKLPLSGVDWSKSERTLVMALSTKCRYCTESAGFYQKLSQQKNVRNDIRLITIMPQSVDEARQYLSENKITVDEIRQTGQEASFVKGTPTLILVDKAGTVLRSWVGKLPPEKEVEVLNDFFLGAEVGRLAPNPEN